MPNKIINRGRSVYRVDISEENIGKTVTTFIASEPHLHYSFRSVRPWHGDRSTTLCNNDCIGSDVENSLYKFVDVRWKAHVRSILTFDLPIALRNGVNTQWFLLEVRQLTLRPVTTTT